MQDIIILGTGGNAIDIADAVAANEQKGANCRVLGFLDDNADLWGQRLGAWPVLGSLGDASRFPQTSFINGIGSPVNFCKKPEIIARTGLSAERFASIIHPTAWVSPSAQLGQGVTILSNVSIGANARLGDHVIVLPNSVISHDDVIGDYSCIASGVCISGNVTIGHCCYLGTKSAIRGFVRIGARVLVGMGSVVLNNISDNQTVVGAPARFLRATVGDSVAA